RGDLRSDQRAEHHCRAIQPGDARGAHEPVEGSTGEGQNLGRFEPDVSIALGRAAMNIRFRTARFGEIEFAEDVIITFPDGVLGFPGDRRYLLLEHDAEGSPFKWLQSLDNPDLAFIVVDPAIVDTNYGFDLDVDLARIIGTSDPA